MVWKRSLSPPLGSVSSVLRILQTLRKHRATLMEDLIVLKMHIFHCQIPLLFGGKVPERLKGKLFVLPQWTIVSVYTAAHSFRIRRFIKLVREIKAPPFSELSVQQRDSVPTSADIY